jgi:hypothetical protein
MIERGTTRGNEIEVVDLKSVGAIPIKVVFEKPIGVSFLVAMTRARMVSVFPY